jgi:hypothetical protein
MSSDRDVTRAERFAEFLRRLRNAPTAATATEAFWQLRDILNAVEDEMTAIPFNPANLQTDGRMYPPQHDSRKPKPSPGVKRYRTRKHNVLIWKNGAIRIQDLFGTVILSKHGGDGL